jgi:hypothetical protein
MVPRVELPPGVELTDQETLVFEEPETVAEKVKEEPSRMLAVAGETLTEMEARGGAPGGGEVGVFEPEVQEERAREIRKQRMENRRSGVALHGRGRRGEDMPIVSDKSAGKGNWTEGQKWGRGRGFQRGSRSPKGAARGARNPPREGA